jgi:hypothetical protein
MDFVDWLLSDEDAANQLEPATKYKSYRFKELDITAVTIENYETELVPSLAEQVSMFVPPLGSFETPDLQRYLELVQTYETSTNDMVLGLSLADQIRIAFSDMKAATICDRFPDIDLNSKRRYRCVAEYLLRQDELIKVRDDNGKLVKKIGNAGKPVVLYRGLPKLHETLKNSGLQNFIKHGRPTQKNPEQSVEEQSNRDRTEDAQPCVGANLCGHG